MTDKGKYFLGHLEERKKKLLFFAEKKDTNLLPPLLAMGISERVGSNWFLDTLTKYIHTYNEPFRQQLHSSQRFSSLNQKRENISEVETSTLNPFERYWFEAFVLSKYTEKLQLIKETNLFFSTKDFLSLFQESKIIVLSRNPVGVASSFINGNLYNRWNYEDRYKQIQRLTTDHEHYSNFLPDDTASEILKVTRLAVLNTILLFSELEGREYTVVSYEDSVREKKAVLEHIKNFVSEVPFDFAHEELTKKTEEITLPTTPNSLFNTKLDKADLSCALSPEEISAVNEETAHLLALSRKIHSNDFIEKIESALMVGDKTLYTPKKQKPKTTVLENKNHNSGEKETRYIPDEESGVSWRNTLISNAEFSDFLNVMNKNGISNLQVGTHLFFNENMIHERGGRIFLDQETKLYTVSSGYENHPVYWVTWIGACAFSKYSGARLPNREEYLGIISQLGNINFSEVNCEYMLGDTTPVDESKVDSLGLLDAVGNVAIWCLDGPENQNHQIKTKFFCGTAWNRAGTVDELKREKSRPIIGTSRGIGIRLVKDDKKRCDQFSPEELATIFREWFAVLEDEQDMERKENYLLEALL